MDHSLQLLEDEETQLSLDRRTVQVEHDKRTIELDAREFELKKKKRAKLTKDAPAPLTPQQAIGRPHDRHAVRSRVQVTEQASISPPNNNGTPRTEDSPWPLEGTDTTTGTKSFTTGSKAKKPTRYHMASQDSESSSRSLAPRAGGSPELSSGVAKTKHYRRERLFKPHSSMGTDCPAWTNRKWWTEVGERLVKDSTHLLDVIVKCRTMYPDHWSPLHFFQRASYITVLRQAGLCNIKKEAGTKITSQDLNYATDPLGQRRFDERNHWTRHPDFLKVLRDEKLVERAGLYWRKDEVPLDAESILRNDGRPEPSGYASHTTNQVVSSPSVPSFSQQPPRMTEEEIVTPLKLRLHRTGRQVNESESELRGSSSPSGPSSFDHSQILATNRHRSVADDDHSEYRESMTISPSQSTYF